MLKRPSVEDDPGVETWKPIYSDLSNGSKGGWNLRKVKSDVLETAKVEKFTVAEQVFALPVVF
eukprot:148109-Pleurochrysis_carterae.AAC.1